MGRPILLATSAEKLLEAVLARLKSLKRVFRFGHVAGAIFEAGEFFQEREGDFADPSRCRGKDLMRDVPPDSAKGTAKFKRMNEIDIVRDISGKFEGAGIAYMLTGSMAMNYYAVPRMTRDIDVVVAISRNDVERVIELFRPEYYVSEESVREALANESSFNLIHHESVIKVDCLVRKRGEYR